MAPDFKYYAFISYTGNDEKWAKWLQHSLEYYHIPSSLCKAYAHVPKKIRPVFWYKEDLSGTVLNQALLQELEVSKYLIVVCSPDAARSEWVNTEVQAFIDQGKRARIIPFIVSGTPHAKNPADECLPPALRYLPPTEELRGIDVNEQGKAHALVDVVATMFGLRFDELWQRYKRRHRKIRACYAAVIVFLMLIAAAIYDYTRKEYLYFADYVDRWGMAEGIIPLNEEEVAHRHRCYRFEYRRIPIGEPNAYSWRLSEVAYINSAGTPQEHSHSERLDRSSRQQYIYNAQTGNLIEVVYCGPSGAASFRHNISEHNGNVAAIADFKAASAEKGAAYIDANITSLAFNFGEKQQRKSTIKRFAYQRDDNGHIVRKTFHSNNDDNLERSIATDATGICGMTYTLDSLGRTVRVEYLNEKGQLCDNRKGIAARAYRYDAYGNIAETRYEGLDGELVLNEQLCAMCVDSCDDHGNIIEETYYDERGNITSNFVGFASYKIKYDDHGNVAEFRNYDENGASCSDMLGVSIIRIKYDEKGNEIERAFYDENDHPCYSKVRASRQLQTYNDKGDVIACSFLDVNGKPCKTNLGFSSWKKTFSEQGEMEEFAFYNEMGMPCLNAYGVAKYVYKYDQGNPIETAYYDENGLPTSQNGISKIAIKFNSQGNPIENASYDKEGKPFRNQDGFFKMTLKYDANGNLQEQCYYDEQGKPCYHKDGISKILASYDTHGNMTQQEYFDTEGRPCRTKNGYAKIVGEYDEKGNVSKVSHFDENGQPCMNRFGYSVVNNMYDSKGKVIDQSYFDEKGNPCIMTEGYARTHIDYDSKGRITKQYLYDCEGRRMPHKNGSYEATFKYDRKGNIIEHAFYNKRGRLCNINLGYAVSTYKYDPRGIRTETAYYDEYGSPCDNSMGYFKEVVLLDNAGQTLAFNFYDSNGRPIYEMVNIPMIGVSVGTAAVHNVPRGSFVLQWNYWMIGDDEQSLLIAQQKSKNRENKIYYITPNMQIGKLHVTSGNPGIGINMVPFNKPKVMEWKYQLEEWKKINE